MVRRDEEIASVLESLGHLSTWMHTTKRWPIHGDLTLHQATALYHIVNSGHMTPSELADLIQSSPASTTSVMDQLTKRKLITREEDPADRRSTIARPTELAIQEWPEIEAKIYSSAGQTFSGWELRDLQQFRDYINRLLLDAPPTIQEDLTKPISAR